MMFFPRVWELIERFKVQCDRKGWKICGSEDVINVREAYHYFIWTRQTHPSTFRRVIGSNTRIPIREGTSYRLVSPSYTAWISSEAIAKEALEVFPETPGLSRRVAIYDISPVYKGKFVCLRMNKTDSAVFQEFEKFLSEEFKIEFKSIPKRYLEAQNI